MNHPLLCVCLFLCLFVCSTVSLDYLAFHGEDNSSSAAHSNAYMKSKLAQVYLRMCPALQHGYFMELPSAKARKRMNPQGAAVAQPASATNTLNPASVGTNPSLTTGETAHTCAAAAGINNGSDRNRITSPAAAALRVGIVSRHIRSGHVVGELVAGLMSVLSTLTGVHVLLFHIRDNDNDSGVNYSDFNNTLSSSPPLLQYDPLRLAVDSAAHSMQSLPLDLNAVAMSVRQSALDVLLYPEIGLDPITYFLGFTRLAPVQLW